MRRIRTTAAFAVMLALGVSLASASPAAAQEEPRFRVWVYSEVTNFFHDSIPAGKEAIERLGQEHDFKVVVSDDSSMFNDETLAGFDAVIFNNTNSTPAAGPLMTADERAALVRYINGGGGYVGIHSASGTERDWEWYQRLVGASFLSHPAIQELEVEVSDRTHPSTRDLPENWTRTEEPYDFQTNPRGSVHVLATYDESTYDGARMGPDHPIAWCQRFEGGRSWYTGMGHGAEAFSEENFLEHLLGGIEWAAGAAAGDCGATVYENFEKVGLVEGSQLVDPMELAVAPDGRVFFIERAGAVKLYDPDTERVTTIGQLDVLVQHTHGLNGLTLDPDFESNGWLYLYYSRPNANGHRLSRFTFDEVSGTLDMASEKVLLDVPAQRQVNAHEAGSMAWDGQGNLFLATGDNALPGQYAPIDERLGQENGDAQATSGNTNDLRGKILRIHPEDDGTSTIPPGNLFAPGTAGTRPEIYVMGVRQPYRIHFDKESGALYWGDVGPDANTSDPRFGPLGFDEWNRALGPGNFGWPYCIADNRPYIDHDYATGTSRGPYDCAGGPTNDSPNNTGLTKLPPANPAWIYYPYNWANFPGEPAFPDTGNGGRLAVGGPTYQFDPELDSETKFPAYYDDKVFIAEWTRGWLKTVTLDDEGRPLTLDPFMGTTQFKRPHDMEFGPDGSLYAIDWGTNYGGAGRGDPNGDSQIYRIDYLRRGERSPVGEATATPDNGPAPLQVRFSSAGSTDPDGQPITFGWDFEADGTVDSTEPDPTHTYTQAGNYDAQLTVTDSTGRTDVVTVPIAAGNTRPETKIERPLHGSFFDFGDRIPYEVAVEDAEDGEIDCSQVIVEPSLGHNDHAHPLERYTGCSGEIATITDHAHDASDNMFYVVDSFYTDKGAPGVLPLTGGDQVVLQPTRKEAEHFTDSFGVEVSSVSEASGRARVADIEPGSWIAYRPINLHNVTRLVLGASSGGTGGTVEVRLDAPDGELIGSAKVGNTGGWSNVEPVGVDIEDPGGTHELFLVFTNPDWQQGDPDLFSIDWLEFRNPMLDPLRAARRNSDLLQTEIDRLREDGSVTPDQSGHLAGSEARLDADVSAAIEAYEAGDEPAVQKHTNKALTTARNAKRWIEEQRSQGSLADDDAQALLLPVDRAIAALSEASGRAFGVSADVTPSSEQVVAGESIGFTATVTNDGESRATRVNVELDAPEGWDVRPQGPTSQSVLPPGQTFTVRYDARVPLDHAPADQPVTGRASYRTTAGATVDLPVETSVEVVAPVEVTALGAPAPVLGGAANEVVVSVRNNRSSEAVHVTAAVDAPSGWDSGSATKTIAPGDAAEIAVPVTPPLEPAAGRVALASLAARVSAPGVPVHGEPRAQTWATPSGDRAALALDSGTSGSPLLAGYRRLAPVDAWDPPKGYGWVGTRPDNRDRGGPDALRRDFTWSGTGRTPGTLRIAVPPGRHRVYALTGDNSFQSSDTVVYVDGARVAETGEFLSAGQFSWLAFELDGGSEGRTVDLVLRGEGYQEYWRLNALVVIPWEVRA